MSGRTEKAKRRLAKQELEKRMNPNQTPPQREINIVAELERFVQGSILLTGDKPESITMTDIAYNLYVQTVQSNAEAFGLNPGFKTGEPTFMDVKLIKKSPIIVPTPPAIAIA